MAAHVPFLKSILDRPGDDGPHLVYADWLEERGEMDLGEYVRLGVELRHLSPEEPEKRRKELQRRIGELLASHREEWLGPLARKTGNVMELHDDDGLLCFRFTCTTPHFLKRLKVEAGLARVPHCWALESTDLGPRIDELLASHDLDWITFIDGNDAPIAADRLESLIACERLGNLRMLNFRGMALGDYGVKLLAATRNLSRLRSLVVSNDSLTEDGLHAILDSRRLTSLTYLSLSNCRWRGQAPSPLRHTSRHVRLARLCLDGGPMGDELAGWLASWAGLATVTWLDLRDGQIGPAGVAALTRSKNLRRLIYLNVSGNPIGDDGARLLAEAPFLGQLNYLKVTHCHLGPAGALALLAAAQLPKTIAILDGNSLGEIGNQLVRQRGRFV